MCTPKLEWPRLPLYSLWELWIQKLDPKPLKFVTGIFSRITVLLIHEDIILRDTHSTAMCGARSSSSKARWTHRNRMSQTEDSGRAKRGSAGCTSERSGPFKNLLRAAHVSKNWWRKSAGLLWGISISLAFFFLFLRVDSFWFLKYSCADAPN